MITLQAPSPAYATTLILPNPRLGDMRRNESTVELHKSIVGTLINTYVQKKEDQRVFELNFDLTRYKSWELWRFYDYHGSDKMRLELYDGEEYFGYLNINPLELEKVSRSLTADSVEQVSVKLEFQTI
jgi:hypothetical protein